MEMRMRTIVNAILRCVAKAHYC
ncbi:hypothetical protein DSM3645_02768 [Blastopirellula marina DSM 3645]|uniref:Uncharacterized protein n=1 Tax=Blastopirellula marina DSM 3645 TaxID=314230 RepID=A3ZVL7_9BACT|nr:hypothetical protein DSM3645_02768 [Blastopirellula marina DSM 3645]